jgi:hypothetical protein
MQFRQQIIPTPRGATLCAVILFSLTLAFAQKAYASRGVPGVDQGNQDHVAGFYILPVELNCVSRNSFGIASPEMIDEGRVVRRRLSERKIIFNRSDDNWNHFCCWVSESIFQVGNFRIQNQQYARKTEVVGHSGKQSILDKIASIVTTVSSLDSSHFSRNVLICEEWENLDRQRDASSGRIAGILAKNIYSYDRISLCPVKTDTQCDIYDWNPWSMRRVEIVASQFYLVFASLPEIIGTSFQSEGEPSDESGRNSSNSGRIDYITQIPETDGQKIARGAVLMAILIIFAYSAIRLRVRDKQGNHGPERGREQKPEHDFGNAESTQRKPPGRSNVL